MIERVEYYEISAYGSNKKKKKIEVRDYDKNRVLIKKGGSSVFVEKELLDDLVFALSKISRDNLTF